MGGAKRRAGQVLHWVAAYTKLSSAEDLNSGGVNSFRLSGSPTGAYNALRVPVRWSLWKRGSKITRSSFVSPVRPWCASHTSMWPSTSRPNQPYAGRFQPAYFRHFGVEAPGRPKQNQTRSSTSVPWCARKITRWSELCCA